MVKYSVDQYSMMIIIKTFQGYSYQILPTVSYTDLKLFPYEEKSIFNKLNIEETNLDVIIIGKKVLKQQIDAVKNELLQKNVCEINHIIFEYDDVLEDNIEVEINNGIVCVCGVYGDENIQFTLDDMGWIETNYDF